MVVLGELQQNDQQLDETTLRSRYMELKELRETKPEREADRMMKAMEKAKATSNALISALQAELAEHRKNEEELSQAVTMAEALHRENEVLRSELAKAHAGLGASTTTTPTASDKTVRFYETLTGMQVKFDGEKAHCTIRVSPETDGGNVYSLSFQLDMSPSGAESDEICYTPTDLMTSGDCLPEYLRDEITCALEPIFLGNCWSRRNMSNLPRILVLQSKKRLPPRSCKRYFLVSRQAQRKRSKMPSEPRIEAR